MSLLTLIHQVASCSWSFLFAPPISLSNTSPRLTRVDPQTLRTYITEEHLDKKKTAIDLSEWEDYWSDVRPVPPCPCLLSPTC